MAKPKASARGAGRPRVDNPELREHLLDVALKSFAAAGVTATSVRSIAADAGVNAALLSASRRRPGRRA